MPRLNSANNAESLLSIDLTANDTELVVQDASLFPEAPFRITVDAEIMEVGYINRTTNTFSDVLRGMEGTTATSHSIGTSVQNRFTAGTFNELISESEFDERFSSLSQSLTRQLDTHLNDTNNPHDVTAEQVGALPLAGGTIEGNLSFQSADSSIINFMNELGDVEGILARSRQANDVRLSNYVSGGRISLTDDGDIVANRKLVIDTGAEFTATLSNNDLLFNRPGMPSYVANRATDGSLILEIGTKDLIRLYEDRIEFLEKMYGPARGSSVQHAYEWGNGGRLGDNPNGWVYLGSSSAGWIRFKDNGQWEMRSNGYITMNPNSHKTVYVDDKQFSITPDITSNTWIDIGGFATTTRGREICIVPNYDNRGYIGTSVLSFIAMYAYRFNTSSSIDYKEQVEDLDCNKTYEMVKNLKPKTYKLKEDLKTQSLQEAPTNMGIVAEEAPKEIQDETGKGIDLYQYITSVLGAVQVLQEKVEALEGR